MEGGAMEASGGFKENGPVENGLENGHEQNGHEHVSANGAIAFEAAQDEERKKDDMAEKVESLNTKLKLALKEVISKDNLVKQHAKVAEDAISGWEKAEAEAARFKQQLDTALQQKTVLDERVGHLDGALKECVKQIRSAKEEQEEALSTKAKEWDAAKAEFEAKLAQANKEADENAAAAEELQKRVSALLESNSQAQAEVKKLSSKMESLEKENSALRHDVRTLKKELVAESKKAADAARQQNAESTKKITKLEAECQKLKGLLRKKAAASHADALDKESRRKSMGRVSCSPRAASVESFDDASEIGVKEIDEKNFALEDEARTLREALERKNKELQAARLMCGKTANRLSVLEEQLESICGAENTSLAGLNGHIETLRAFGSNEGSGNTSQGSCNGDEADEADDWASALAAELAQLKKDNKKPDKLLDTTSFDLMDDFLEMEKLTSNLPHENGQLWDNSPKAATANVSERSEQEMVLELKERELLDSKIKCEALEHKVSDLESHLHQLRMESSSGRSPELSSIVNLLASIEVLAKNAGADYDTFEPAVAVNGSLRCRTVWKNADLSSTIVGLISAGNQLMHGAAVEDLFAQVTKVLKLVSEICFASKSSDTATIKSLKETSSSLQSEVARLGTQLLQTNAEREAAERERTTADESLARVRQELLSGQEALDCLKAEKASLEKQLNAADVALQEKDAALQEKDATLTSLASERDVHTENLKLQSGRSSLLETELQIAMQEVQTAKGNVDNMKEGLNRAEAERDATKADLEASRLQLEKLSEELAEALSEKGSLDEQWQAQLSTIAMLEDSLRTEKAARDSLTAVNVDVEKMVVECAELKYDKQRLEKALVQTREQLQEEVGTLTSRIQQLENDLTKSMTEKEESSHLAEEMRGQLGRLALLEEAAQKLESDKSTAEQRASDLDVEISRVKSENTGLQQSMEVLTVQLVEERSKVNDLEEELTRMELENVELEQRTRQGEERLKAQQASFISLQDEFYQMKMEKEDMEQTVTIGDQNLQQSHNRIKALDADCSRMKSEFDAEMGRMQEELKVAVAEKDGLSSELAASTKLVEQVHEELRKEKAEAESQLAVAVNQIKQLQAECSRLDCERNRLEEELASAEDIVHTRSEGNLSDELDSLKTENKELEQLLTAAKDSIEALTGEAKKMEGEKAEMEHDLELLRVRWKSHVFEADELLASVRAELSLALKAKQLVEQQLAESFSAKAHLQYQLKAAEHEASQLMQKSKALEQELELQLQRQTNALPEASHMRASQDQGPDVAAKLDECHRAILSLGHQLQSLSASRSSPALSEESIGTQHLHKLEGGAEVNSSNNAEDQAATAAAAAGAATPAAAAAPENEEGSFDGKVYVPSVPLEGRPRCKSTSTSPAKPVKSSSSSRGGDVSKSLDMGEKSSSSSAFTRFFRGKSSSNSHHAS